MSNQFVDARIARVRTMMDERGYDAVLVRDEANLRWLTGALSVFDFCGEYPHAALITRDASYLHTDSRYYHAFVDALATTQWQVDMEVIGIPHWVAAKISENKLGTVAIEDDMQLSFYTMMNRAVEDASAVCNFPQMHDDIKTMRATKDAEEIEIMRAAQAITDKAFTHMCSYIKPGMTEKSIRNELERYMYELGADGLSFGSIVASGPNTANPHAVPGDRVAQKGDFVLMDYGARLGDYCSDMTRTVVLGEPTDEQRALYDLVRKAHEECAAAIKPGCIGKEIHELSVKVISDAGFGDYYGHGLGHGVGIDIHEYPNLGRSWDKPVDEGSVVTVEPGVYLPGVGGVRLEDYGVVTAEGFEPFTQSTHELVVIEC